MSDPITLTEGQQTGYEAFVQFMLDPNQAVFVLEGYSGTGKTTLVQTILDRMPKLLRTMKTIDPSSYQREIILTATTNKAAEAFAQITGEDVRTIHSVLGLRVHKDYTTGKSKLVPRSNAEILEDVILLVDEASYIDENLDYLIEARTKNCKVILIGDPAQLLNVNCDKSPVFDAGYNTAKLTEVVRQAKGNPIIDLATAFRHTVNTGEWSQFTPDGTHIKYLDRDQFEDAIINEFDDPTWSHSRSKVLAWTNKTVIRYNHAIRDYVKGAPNFHVGDYAVCNKYVSYKRDSIKTDQLVRISHISPPASELGVPGHQFVLDGKVEFFMPDSVDAMKARLALAKGKQDYQSIRIIEETWIDLRAAYACTINKSQGSTYDSVFIDLDDVKKCSNGNQIARMLYVAVSRARHTVYLCGDLI